MDNDNKEKNQPGWKLYCKIIANYLLAAAIILLLVLVLPKALALMWPFVVGWIIAMMANPLVHFLENKLKILRKHGTVIVIITVLVLIISLLYALFYVLIKQGIGFAENLPDIYKTASDTIQATIDRWRVDLEILPQGTQDYLNTIVEKAGDIINDLVGGIMSTNLTFSNAGLVVKSVAEGLLMTVITILLCYFLTAEHDNIIKVYHEKMPEGIKKTYKMVMDNIVNALAGYFKAQLKIMICVFAILAVGFLCMRIEYAVWIALIIAFVDFLPVLCSGAIMWPWCLYEVVAGNYARAIVLFVLYIICQAVRQFLQPKMVADSIGLSPLATIFYMFIGYRVSGVLGMIIAIPIGMIITTFYKAGLFDTLIRGAKIIAKDIDEWRKF